MGYDVIVVGAGSAGCVVASRLSEDSNRSVLLLEAGPDYPADALPADIHCADFPAYSHDWDYYSEPGRLRRPIHLPRGKLVGGCSATNATFAMRGWPVDDDEWAGLRVLGWSFAQVLPYFRRLETDLDFADEWHGRAGPIPIRRFAPDELNSLQRAFLVACTEAGFPQVADHNAPGAIGAGVGPFNAVAGVRQSAAQTYLSLARGRPNLTIRSGVLVDRVAFAGRRAAGVHTIAPAAWIPAGQVILSAGSYASPAILLRSGVGPASELRALRIDVVADLPGVGTGLIDHPLFGVRFAVAPEVAAGNRTPLAQVVLTARSAPGVPGYDLLVIPSATFAVNAAAPGGWVAMLFVALLKPRSRGRVRLRSANPHDPPQIDLNYFDHEADLPRICQGVRIARHLSGMRPLAGLLGPELIPGPTVDDSDHEIGAAVLDHVETFHHPVGTCRMGPSDEPYAVVGSAGLVHGLEGLSVIDASILPAIPAAPTNLATIMVAERLASA